MTITVFFQYVMLLMLGADLLIPAVSYYQYYKKTHLLPQILMSVVKIGMLIFLYLLARNLESSLLQSIFIGSLSSDYSNRYRIFIYAFSSALWFILDYIFMVICQYIIPGKKLRSIWGFVLLPVSQLLMLFPLTSWIQMESVIGIVCLVVVQLLYQLLNLYWIVWVLNQDKREAEEEEYRQLQEVMAKEEIYYRKLDEQQFQMGRIRHDYQNFLGTVRHLMKTDEKEALEFLDQMILQLDSIPTEEAITESDVTG